MSDRFVITLRVFDRVYRLKINRKDEKKYRDAAETIEKKTNQYKGYFSGSDSNKLLERDYLAMTAIQALSETEELTAENIFFEEKAQYLIEKIDGFLKKTK